MPVLSVLDRHRPDIVNVLGKYWGARTRSLERAGYDDVEDLAHDVCVLMLDREQRHLASAWDASKGRWSTWVIWASRTLVSSRARGLERDRARALAFGLEPEPLPRPDEWAEAMAAVQLRQATRSRPS